MCSVYCFPNHCVVVGERGWLGCIWVWSSSRILVTQMVKFLWIFEIVNFYEIYNFVSISFSFLYSFINWLRHHTLMYHYASPTSGEAYRDRQLTTNFELWVEIFCVPTCFHVRIPKPCLSVRPSVRLSAPREKISS